MLAFSTHKVFAEQGDTRWVRTGTDPDGNCFFHAYAYCVEPNTFRDLNKEERRQRVLTIKKYVAEHITMDDIIDMIHPDAFEKFLPEFNKMIHPLKEPDLRNQPPLSLRKYINLLYQTHPVLSQSDEFKEKMYSLLFSYKSSIQNYVLQHGTWMFDALFPLLMRILQVNIIIISHETGKKITHTRQHNSPHTIYIYHVHDHYESVGAYQNNIMCRVFEIDLF